MKVEKYITETIKFLKDKIEIDSISLKNFYLVYCISFCSNYIRIDEWDRDLKDLDYQKLKLEVIDKLNKNIFCELDLKDKNLILYADWFKKNPPNYTTEDVLGSIYIMCSKKEHRKKLGEHYTENNLVEFILNELGSYITTDKKIIDPACGSGNFLVRILGMFLSNGTYEDNQKTINKMRNEQFLIGVDIQEIPCFITKLRILMEIVFYQQEIDSNIIFPIYKIDSLSSKCTLLEDNQYDLVITNPPFLRYQLIDVNMRDNLKDSYSSATGRFDLYTLFIEKGLKMTKHSGKVVVLCSDKFMETQYGRGIREYIIENAQLKSVYDLSSIFPFKAAVLSGIYFFNKPSNKKGNTLPAKWYKVTKSEEGLSKENLGKLVYEEKWRYVNINREKLLVKIQKNSDVLLNDMVYKISVGLQTTQDNVFSREMTNEFIMNNNFEKEFLKPLLRGRNLEKWTFKWSGNKKGVDTYVLYPYKDIKGQSIPININNYNNIESYLLKYYKELSGREYFKNHGSKRWYEHWNARSFNLFKGIKILTPELSSNNRFSLDVDGYFYNGTIYGIKLKEEYDLNDYKYLLGILNSNVLDFVHKNLNSTHLQSKKYRYQASIMKKYPIVYKNKNTMDYKKIIEIVNELIESNTDSTMLEKELNKIVYRMYNLSATERAIIENFCES